MITHIEKGYKVPSLENLIKILAALEMSFILKSER